MISVAQPLLCTVIDMSMALLFATASAEKLRAMSMFRGVLADYRVLPEAVVRPAAWLIAAAEAGIALAWLGGYAGPAALASAVLLAAYGAGMSVNLARGRRHVSCGCGAGGEVPLSWWLVGRNGLLAAAALVALIPAPERSLGLADYAVALAATGCVALLYLAAHQLAANSAGESAWGHARSRQRDMAELRSAMSSGSDG